MIGRLRGTIIEKQPPKVLIEVGGIGYDVFMPMTCFYELPENGLEVIVLTHFSVREDAQILYGFNQEQERELFRELIKVNGVGPKLALAILSGMSAAQFISAVEQGEIKTLVKLPGVGNKTAQRLIVEMKDRLKHFGEQSSNVSLVSDLDSVQKLANQIESEAVSALIALGYKPQEASRIISKVINPDMDCETLIRKALKSVL
ncbi:Holliday junction branch migration protein RuvA [Gilliamella sp. Imp1-1]|uniref:Holliday junction branch migration protein RuvA n=1 Tax=Gilliamella sp. Imp1-1 TaxID=3120248 RepID=UPI000461898B|nr:Holliday junction branch migration protein RuvA [Gilliamella apicola]KDN10150.1 Holliday junction DNA helicase RuvA [Gilliamella apicola]OCG54170.1 Holliday junction DNA helicase RuvA [Gilliamella apicola]